MATVTVSLPEDFREAKRRFPGVNWNSVLKAGILKRLEELKRFEKMQRGGL